MTTTSRTTQPAEWAPHRACWTAYPADPELWLSDLGTAQQEFVAMCRHIGQGEALRILARQDVIPQLQQQLSGVEAQFFAIPYGDVWLRDTGPIFLRQHDAWVAGCFKFNGWGGKYIFEHDDKVAAAVAGASQCAPVPQNFVLEGGSIEVDGEGTCLTSRQCLLNPNRNPAMDQAAIEAALRQSLGVERVLWVTDGLQNDHTDGHIDTIARYVGPGHVMCMSPAGPEDPNRDVLQRIAAELHGLVDAQGRHLKVSQVISPGAVHNADGDLMPASYCNFYIGNRTVVVPTYGVSQDSHAVQQIAALFPDRRVVGSAARAILTGGGAFHCMTQQQPA